ncbi:MAG: 3-deoxy-8-phosphooctulonate synthase [Bacteroidota bacterium]|nr:3-deoxy-8-phosphooctulonate synthase [Bacteroidota bacterium]
MEKRNKPELGFVIPSLKHTQGNGFLLIAGPCVVENEEIPFKIAEKVGQIAKDLRIPFIFKASYKKANRSKLDSFTGIGDLEALDIIKNIGQELDLPTITDIHAEHEAIIAAEYADVLQIPAFLCRQTDLLIAAAYTEKPINIKKAQFLSAEAMQFAVEKIVQSGNEKIMITERGNMYGYQDLVVDFRNIPLLKENPYPVVLDITHSLQRPNQSSGVTGGAPDMIETIARAGIAVGVDGLFIETHPDPANAMSDGENMLNLGLLEGLLTRLVKIRKAIQ